jgi:hypothetical protein
MKCLLFSIAILLTFLTVQAQTSHQPTFVKGTNTEELVLGVLNYAPEQMNTYKNALNQVNGVTFMKVCHSQKIWLLHVDRSIQSNNTAIENTIKAITPSAEIFHKWSNFADVESMCKDEFIKQ